MGKSSHRSNCVVRPLAERSRHRHPRRPTFSVCLAGGRGLAHNRCLAIPAAVHHAYALRVDGELSEDEGTAGSRTYMNLGAGLNRPSASETDPPPFLQWTTPPLPHDLDLIGSIELQLDAACTAPDTAFIAV